MIIVTGGAGFIGSALVWDLNQRGIDDILIVDHLGTSEKWKNCVGLKFRDYCERDTFLEQLHAGMFDPVEAVLHMGACSSTTERDATFLINNNFEYTKAVALYCVDHGIRFVYASSGATYGAGEQGYSDASIDTLKPLNMYGYSKHLFDLWAERHGLLETIVGVKFFNVFGPNEYHKGSMRSLVNKTYNQVLSHGKMQLFKSCHPDYKDGEQKRDFIYVKDAVEMTLFFLDKKKVGGIFNIGTGIPRTWNDLARALFAAMGKKECIEYVDMPEELKGKYQNFTQADITKLRSVRYAHPLYSLEHAVKEYVQQYMAQGKYLE